MTKQPRLWRLDATARTLLLWAPDSESIPEILWFGSTLPDNIDAGAVADLQDLPVPMAKLDAAVPLHLLPQPSTGLDTSPALRGHRNGADFAHRFVPQHIDVQPHAIHINCVAAEASLGIIIELQLHDTSGVLSINTTLTNSGTTPYTVDWLASASLPLPEHYAECLYLSGRWGLEFQAQRQSITSGRLLLENNRGRTSHELYPGIVAGSDGFSEQHGDVIAAQLAWSGSHKTVVEQLSDGRLALQCGVSLDPGELILKAGESFTTPTLHISRGSGMNDTSQAMHRYARTQILPAWTRTPRPIHANSWEALYFDHDIDKLKDLIDAAAELGAERFVLDDGWFPARRSDTAGLGDWWVDNSVYPEGLHPIVEHTRAAGLQFGLWFEPEMVNPDSDLYRQHPDWVLHLNTIDTPLARNQLVLNMELPQVQNYLFDKISALVNEYNVDYIKWDFNRDLVMAGDGQRSRMRHQPTGSYALMQRLNERFDQLEIESCSSGGARADWGVLAHTGRVWTSDSIDAIDRVRIQRGYSLFNPPEIMGAHIGHELAHLTGRSIDLHTRAIVALQGQLGFEIDARHLDNDERKQLQHYVSLYKQHREWISESTTWRLDIRHDAMTQSGLVSADHRQSLWFAIATQSIEQTTPGKLQPTGLDPKRQYRVTLASNNAQHFVHHSKHIPAWLTDAPVICGEVLMQLGLRLPVMPANSALLIDISSQ
ncbi:MAG: alpha-galactosidase [Pseudomonadota bacterium]